MNKKLLTLFLFISQLGLFSQTYYAFPDSSATWVESHSNGASYPCIHYWDREIYIAKDTTFGGFIYKKLIYNENEYIVPYSGCWSTLNTYANGMTYGYLRDDTSSRIVYLLGSPISINQGDTLLYDFSKQVGDTIPSLLAPYVIDSIKNVIIAGVARRSFYIRFPASNGQGATTSIIEGIGTEKGIVYFPDNWEGGDMLMCFSQNDKKLYPDTNGVCQHINSVGVMEQGKVRVFPNPATDKIYFEGIMNGRTRITSLVGETILEKELKGSFLDVSNIPAGIYFLDLSSEGIKERKKIIIAR